jgi:riboflavin synthase
MFTGLIEATGRVKSLAAIGDQARLGLVIPFAEELKAGDSVAVNGCCLTVAEISTDAVFFDLLSQTLRVTSLGKSHDGSLVNLERAMLASARLGGHFVQGHVDDTGVIRDLSTHGQDHRLEVSLPQEIQKFCIDKGSIAIDGISLTIAELHADSAVFWITPHTFAHTNLQQAKTGDIVNLEADLLAKYAARFAGGSK